MASNATLSHCFCVAVVLWILPHAQPGPERLRVLLQDQRAEEEVAGAVQHGNVSRCLSPAQRGRSRMTGAIRLRCRPPGYSSWAACVIYEGHETATEETRRTGGAATPDQRGGKWSANGFVAAF